MSAAGRKREHQAPRVPPTNWIEEHRGELRADVTWYPDLPHYYIQISDGALAWSGWFAWTRAGAERKAARLLRKLTRDKQLRAERSFQL